MYDAAIVGGGAAGLSAALLLGRARRRILVFDDGRQRNRFARETHGFLSRDGVQPLELLQNAREQLERYDVESTNATVAEIMPNGSHFGIRDASGQEIKARRLVLATGVRDTLPEIDGLQALWGQSIFTCPYCDGWEVRDRRLATFGTTRSGVQLAQELFQWSPDLLVCSDLRTKIAPSERSWLTENAIRVKESPIRRLLGNDGALQTIEFEDGETIERDALFLSVPLEQCSDLPERLGCNITVRGQIDVDNDYRTSVPGCYAVGDAVTHLHQVVFAAASGARAAIALNNDLMGF